ncbi:MAG: permease [Ignavibacteriales bacterium]|nr:permease [Ignavibacteriales bacterium]
MEYVQSLISEIIFFFNEMAIYLVFGFLVAGLLYIFFPSSFVFKHIGKNNLSSVVKSSLFGIPLPLCSCGVIPAATAMRKKGASKGATVSFLISTPQIGTDSFVITYSLLGWVFAVVRIIASAITALFAGIITNIFNRNDNAIVEEPIINKYNDNARTRTKTMFNYVQKELFGSIAKYIAVGILLAGLISAFVPNDFFELYLNNQFLSMLIMLVIAIPLYVCATASTPIAASLILKGLSPGAALVFLLAGPATNAVTITTIVKMLGKKVLLIYLGSIIIVSFVLGYLLNLLFFETSLSIMHLHEHEVLPEWLKISGSIILLSMFFGHFCLIMRNKLKTNDLNTMRRKSLEVVGMTCNHCALTVKKAVESIESTSNVEVNLKSGIVFYNYTKDNIEEIKNAIMKSGYDIQ